MASTQQIKARIKSVKNTKQITKAMELVAASKMRRAQETTLASRDYSLTARKILTRLREITDVSKHPLFAVSPLKKRILIVITSDRGLAGAYNGNVLRRLTKELTADQKAGVETQLIVIGKQAARFAAKLEGVSVMGSYDNMPEKPAIADLEPILQSLKSGFVGADGLTYASRYQVWLRTLKRLVQARQAAEAEEQGAMSKEQGGLQDENSSLKPQDSRPEKAVDAVDILYTDFKSSVVQEVALQRLLPAAFTEAKVSADLEAAIFEPSPEEVLNKVAESLVDVQLWQAYLESQASEQSARMMAMKTASDNAGDLIDDLTLEMNTARQAAITQELAEIVGGAEAIS